MAEGFVNVTEGSGKKLHTWNRTIGANSVEDEYVLLGENALATYVATNNSSGGSSSTATANSHVYQLMAGASLVVRVRRIRIFQATLATTVAHVEWRVHRLSTAGTGGTSETPQAYDLGDPACGATAMRLPTVKGTETGLIASATGTLVQTASASVRFAEPMVDWDFDRLRTKPIIIPPGTTNGICVKNPAATAGATVMVVIDFTESTY